MDACGRLAMTDLLGKVRRRLASEDGSVGVVVALFIFFALGLITMTWNTAQLSKEKMRLQNAADAAALAHAAWQARGINAVQNINDEMYQALTFADTLRKVSIAFEVVAQGLDAASVGPWAFITKPLAIAAHLVGALTGAVSGHVSHNICNIFLKYLAIFYAKGSALLGYWDAQQLAGLNDADPLATLGEFLNLKFGFYAYGFSWPFKDAFMLPLEQVEKSGKPWKAGDVNYPFDAAPAPWKAIYEAFNTSKGWEVKPFISKRGDATGVDALPGPTLWLAFKLDRHVQTLPLDPFIGKFEDGKMPDAAKSRGIPLFALAAAKCVTGDVVPVSEKTEKNKANQRPAGFGTGATAKLVPISDVFAGIHEIAEGIVSAIIYH